MYRKETDETSREHRGMKKSHLERQFELLLKSWKIKGFEREYQFHPKRKWKIDFANTKHGIAVEIEGGIWSGGRHTRPQGYIKDVEKYNALTLNGWRLLRYTCIAEMLEFREHYKLLLEQE
jgi:very-short-patch-repair endonuclease